MLPGVSYFLMILVAPKVEAIYQHAGIELPVYYQGMRSVAVFLQSYFLGLILLVAVVGLFEWKCRSENKTMIRTAMFVGLSLISANGAFWMAFVYISSLVDIAAAFAGRVG